MARINQNSLSTLLASPAAELQVSFEEDTRSRSLYFCLLILAGAGSYGFSIGLWRSPLQACFTAIKFPLILFLCAFLNSLANAMLAPLLGVRIGFRASLSANLFCFAIAAVILGALSPVFIYQSLSAPPLAEAPPLIYSTLLLTQVVAIAIAGVIGNVKQLGLLQACSANSGAARNVLISWLAVNLVTGTQLTWILRPLVGSPGLPVQFLRPNAFESNFFEAVYRIIMSLITN